MLEWNVYVGDWNSGKIQPYNIFNHYSFVEDCRKAYYKHRKDKASFLDAVHSALMYFYWSKCEWEIVLDHWPHNDKFDGMKIDVHDQVMLNWSKFADYIWTYKDELRQKAGE